MQTKQGMHFNAKERQHIYDALSRLRQDLVDMQRKHQALDVEELINRFFKEATDGQRQQRV